VNFNFFRIGPVDLTTGIKNFPPFLLLAPPHHHRFLGTVKGTRSVPTVTDSLFSQGLISTESIAISFNPTSGSGDNVNGELTFGATDTSK
jgi:hypothetical protein